MLESRTRPTDLAESEPLPDTFLDFCVEHLGISLTIGQRVLVLVTFDDVNPEDLETEEERRLAAKFFGDGVDCIPDHCRTVAYWLKGARMGGTYLWALFLTYRAFTAELVDLAPGEVAFGVIVAPELKTARQALRYCTGAIHSSKRLRSSIVGKPTNDSIALIRDDGRRVTIECRAASKGGKATRGFTYFGGLLDESAFFFDAESGVVNDSEIYRSISVRLLPGAKLGVISTAYAERGLLWEKIQENHGSPKTGLAAIAPTLDVRDTERNRFVVAEERQRDPLNASREFDCVPFDTGNSAFFDAASIDAAIVKLPEVNFGEHRDPCVLSIDTAFRRDATGGCVTRLNGRTFTLAERTIIRPERGKPLKPSSVIGELVDRGKAHGTRTIVADQHYIETVREHSGGLTLVEAPAGNAGKVSVYLTAKTALLEQRVKIPESHKDLIRQLKDVVAKQLPGGGLQISSPRSSVSGHGDAASAFVLGIWYLDQGSFSDVDEEGLGGSVSDRWAASGDDDDDWD